MNRENFSAINVENPSSNHRVYYAPAASTSGDKVKIYKYAFERINNEYANHILGINDPVKQAVAKYKWAEFIFENLPHYSADRSDLFRGAQLMCINAFYAVQRERYNAKHDLQDAIQRLSELQKRKNLPGDVSAHDLSRAIRRVKSCRKHFDCVMSGCSDELFEKMRQRADEFEYFW